MSDNGDITVFARASICLTRKGALKICSIVNGSFRTVRKVCIYLLMGNNKPKCSDPTHEDLT